METAELLREILRCLETIIYIIRPRPAYVRQNAIPSSPAPAEGYDVCGWGNEAAGYRAEDEIG